MAQELAKKVLRTPTKTIKCGYVIASRKIWAIPCIFQWGNLSSSSLIQMEKVPLKRKLRSFWWLVSETFTETRTFLWGEIENYFSAKGSLKNLNSKMAKKNRSLRYLASWQTNTTRSIQSRSLSMRTTTQSVHCCLLMHRQEDLISAGLIKT